MNLTDGKTQIQAILSGHAVDMYNQDHPDRSLKEQDPIHYRIQLNDFEIVLGYSASEPNVHLFVKQFNIQWALGKTKTPTGKKVKRHKALWNHMWTVFSMINEPQRAEEKEKPDNSNGSVVSQDGLSFREGKKQDLVPDSGFSQEAFMSQIPLGYQETAVKSISDAGNGLYRNPGQLLEHLGSVPKSHQRAPYPGIATEEGQFNGGSHPLKMIDEKKIPSISQEYLGGSVQGTSAGNEAGKPTTKDDKHPGLAESRSDHGQVANSLGASLEANDLPAPTAVKASSKLSTTMLDIWCGLTEIHDRDIHIPKDQSALLQDNTCWFPPLPDKVGPSMNVPTSLLSEWNNIVLQRSRLAHEKRQKLENLRERSPPATAEHHEPTPNPTSPALSASSKSSSQAVSSWSLSPPNRNPPQVGLPADSPTSAIRRPRDSESPRLDDNSAMDVQAAENTGAGIHCNGDFNQPSSSGLIEGRQLPDQSPRQADEGPKSVDVPMAQAQEMYYESDDETNESVMDAVVPCPLGYSSQPVSSMEQVEKESVNLNAPHSQIKTHGHIQITEMPVTGPTSFCSERSGIDMNSDTQQLSSQATKSSSHQIHNADGSNDNTSKGGSSQEQHHSSQTDGTNESNQVHVKGTQISGGNPAMQDTTPNSHGAFVPNSSGSYGREQSVPLSVPRDQHRGTPQPFSAYRDLAMLQSDDGNDSSSIQSVNGEASFGCTPADTVAPSLKRDAPLVEAQAVPTKRQKTRSSASENMGKGEKRLTSNIMSRRESYINSTPNRPDAKHAYEKFRTDYPSYVGDSAHFFKLCDKLQSLRNEGFFKRSPQWDDFIMIHLEQYPSYIQLCREMDARVLEYEEYFKTHFVNPIHKKRSLTAAAIEVSAAQSAATNWGSVASSPSVSRGKTTTSFTTSLVDRLSNFHANSFGHDPQSNSSSKGSSPSASVIGSPSPSENTQRNRSLSARPSVSEGRQTPVLETIETIEPEYPGSPASSTSSHESSEHDSVAGDPAASQQLQMENALALSRNASIHYPDSEDDNTEVEHSVPESDHGNDDMQIQEEKYDEMETTHETASIELGDEEPLTKPHGPLPEAISEDNDDDGSENWFTSLRHIVNPPTGVWSDDPNTPFKMWARADQNVKVEVLQRGGRYREVDDKGVIQRSLTHRQPGR